MLRYSNSHFGRGRSLDTAKAAASAACWAALVAVSVSVSQADAAGDGQLAQFQIPKPTTGGGKDKPQQRLIYEYSYSTESNAVYHRNPDLDPGVRDDSLILTPNVIGFITYRPTDWLETKAEIIFDWEIAAKEEQVVILPNGEANVAPDRRFSLLPDQAYVTLKNVTTPFEFTVGRRNYEDERHWLYDTSIDVFRAAFKVGKFNTESLVGRQNLVDLDLLKRDAPDRINTYMVNTTYRGIEDVRISAYAILRDDRAGVEGKPLLLGLRSQGAPTDAFSYWAELAHLRGRDEVSRPFAGYAVDVGGTYRFLGLPLSPNVTLGYAYATGEEPAGSGADNGFRQTGLQSNETKFAGVTEFKIYGEALDPELSNLEIVTFGLGSRPMPGTSIDLIYHRYRLDKIADEIRNWGLTAQMNQVESRLSRDVGDAIDIVFGFRSLFGVKRLGMDIRAGVFFPGTAFIRNVGDEANPILRKGSNGYSIAVKFWW